MEVTPAKLVPLGSVTKWLSGGTPSRAVDEFWSGTIPWISASTLRATEIFNSDQCVTVDAVASGSKMAPVGATLLLVRGSALHNEILAGLVVKPVCFNQDVKALIPSPNVFPKFLTYSLLGRESELLKLVSSAGNTAGVLDTKTVQEFSVWIPSLEEQRVIATALSDMDALLDGLDRLIAKKRAIKQATMQQLLTGQTRLPGFGGEWQVRLLGDVADVKTGPFGSSLHESDYVSDGIPIITVEHLGEFGVKHVNLPMVSTADRKRLSAYHLEVGDIVFSRVGSVDRNALIRESEDGWLFSGRLLRVRPQRNFVSSMFLSYQFHSEPFKLAVRNVAVGQTMASLNTRILNNLKVYLPAISEQVAIAAVLSDMDTEITALETRRTKTRALKQAMMQELLTGRTRLVECGAKPIEKEVAQAEGRKANVHFLRSVLAAEIIDQLHDQPTFGHVKFEKMMFLVEHLCDVDTGSTYHRKAAGPYDNRALRSIDSQLQKQQWFDVRKEDGRYRYVPMAKRGGHKQYFDRHFSGIGEAVGNILATFKTAKTEQCEIVATLLAAWNDLLREKGAVSDEVIVHEVLNNWHESKLRIPEDRWLKALVWMREKGFVPKGVIPT